MGAQAKEHGPHLKLNNDFVLAEYFKQRVLDAADVVMAPTINYGFYPAFVEYPGSTTVSLETARDTVLGIVRTLAGHGPKKFYILNTGVSTVRALTPAVEIAAAEGITIRFFAWTSIADVEKTVLKQEGGTHADEGETSMMLYIAPESVDMTKAVKDFHPRIGTGPFRRVEGQPGTYSPSGSWGDPTLATREKGRILAEAAVAVMLREIEELRVR
jgi:creatinine amidohydrolase